MQHKSPVKSKYAKRRSVKKVSLKRKSIKRRSVKKASKRKSVKRKSAKRKSAKRKSAKRKSAKRKSAKRKQIGGGDYTDPKFDYNLPIPDQIKEIIKMISFDRKSSIDQELLVEKHLNFLCDTLGYHSNFLLQTGNALAQAMVTLKNDIKK